MTIQIITLLRRLFPFFTGVFSVYVAVAGLLGCILARKYAPGGFSGEVAHLPSCWPELQMFDTIAPRCESGLNNRLWFLALGLPRLLIALPFFIVAMADYAIGAHSSYLEGGEMELVLLVLSALSALPIMIYCRAFAFWRKDAPWLAIAISLMLMTDYGMIAYFYFR